MRFRSIVLLIVLVLVLGAIKTSYAQDDEDSGIVIDDPMLLGMDADTFERFFADARSIPDVGFTDVRDFIDNFQVWADRELVERGMARAEITAPELREQRELVLTFEDQPLKFRDDGQEFDMEPGDGIFTAVVPLKLPSFLAEQATGMREMEEIVASLKEFPQFEGREVVEDEARNELIELLQGDNIIVQRSRFLREFGPELEQMEPFAILERLEIEPESTPILEAKRRDNLLDTIFDVRLFDIPIVVFSKVLPADVDAAHSLMITDVAVVEDPARTFDVCAPGGGTPGGPWTFAYLMREMAQGSGLTAEDFTLQWLHTWILPQEANGILVADPGRAAQLTAEVINPWIAASGGTPDLDLFPARLLSIVSRSDLADTLGYSTAGSGGEARFVFGLVRNTPGGCTSLPFTVIFEYGIQANGCFDLKSWVQQWKDLDANPVGSAAYNTALEAITHQFTDHGTNSSQLPNQSSLAQLRTNENALNPTWELREFTLQGPGSSSPGQLDLVTVKQTPRFGLNNSPTLAAYIMSDTAAILANSHTVPNRFPTIIDPFLDATALTPFGTFWNAPGIVGLPSGVDLRHNLSLSTCSGCHMRETETLFTHVGFLGTRAPGTPAALSGFLTGITVVDPVDAATTRTFNDLARRQLRMADVLNSSCFILPFVFPELNMVH